VPGAKLLVEQHGRVFTVLNVISNDSLAAAPGPARPHHCRREHWRHLESRAPKTFGACFVQVFDLFTLLS
jgi:hypothetical protein